MDSVRNPIRLNETWRKIRPFRNTYSAGRVFSLFFPRGVLNVLGGMQVLIYQRSNDEQLSIVPRR